MIPTGELLADHGVAERPGGVHGGRQARAVDRPRQARYHLPRLIRRGRVAAGGRDVAAQVEIESTLSYSSCKSCDQADQLRVHLVSTWGLPWGNLGSTWGQPGVNIGSTCTALP